MVVRKITNSGKKVIGKFASLKMKKTVHWESQIERDYIYLLEFDLGVIRYDDQPLRIDYTADGKKHHYTPDFLVQRAHIKQLVEVKPKEKVSTKEHDLLFRTVSPICVEYGYEFIVVTDRMIRVQPFLNNIRLLYRYASTPIYLSHQIYCRDFLKEKGEAKIAEVIHLFASKGIGAQTVYALIYFGVLAIDLMKPVDSSARVRLPSSDIGEKELSDVRRKV